MTPFTWRASVYLKVGVLHKDPHHITDSIARNVSIKARPAHHLQKIMPSPFALCVGVRATKQQKLDFVYGNPVFFLINVLS